MSNQPYGAPYEGYDPYQQQSGHQPHPDHQQQGHQPQPGYQQPDWQGHDETQDAQAQQYTQQWEGQTWETQAHMPVAPADVTETAYLPPQSPVQPPAPGMAAQQAGAGHQQYAPQQPPSYEPQQPSFHGGTASHDGTATPAPAQSGTAPEAPAFGPATLTGNARVTDAQRARAEGRSPIIEPGAQPALITAVLGALLSGAAVIGQYALVVPLVILQAVTAAGWFRLNGMWPARQGIALAFAGAVTADVVLLVAGRENAPAAILGTLGVWVLLTLVLQLRSHADPDERMYGLMATVTSAALSIIAAGHLAAAPDAVSVGAGAVAVAIVVRALPLPTVVSVAAALLAGAGAGLVLGGMTEVGTQGAFLGLGAAVCALIGHRVASYDYPSRFVHMTAGVALPLTAAAPVVYLLGRALG
ncbi:hypothetical protein [Streptomyces acidicola]|uniref:Uncharacterized protein n=1 Tax=Streptomyces acidicola TaxID=2596892 RepID=A0A5N8WZZ5_9ACTN|nr:hypothetical protein [Streptomyces acidicola]MPY52950.1 hypothetical protein [Streptomyces acidicola]